MVIKKAVCHLGRHETGETLLWLSKMENVPIWNGHFKILTLQPNPGLLEVQKGQKKCMDFIQKLDHCNLVARKTPTRCIWLINCQNTN